MTQSKQFEIAANDLVEANRIHLRGKLAWLLLFFSIGLIAVWVYVILSKPMGLGTDLLLGLLVIVVGALGGLGGYALQYFLIVPISAGISYRQQRSLRRSFNLSWNEDGVATTSASATGLMPWSDYRKWLEGKNLFLLYHSNRLYQLVPKRAFVDQEGVTRFREELRRRIAVRPGLVQR